jgi:hypothetical protein
LKHTGDKPFRVSCPTCKTPSEYGLTTVAAVPSAPSVPEGATWGPVVELTLIRAALGTGLHTTGYFNLPVVHYRVSIQFPFDVYSVSIQCLFSVCSVFVQCLSSKSPIVQGLFGLHAASVYNEAVIISCIHVQELGQKDPC